ncbi:hypothetical protein JCM33374_g1489 [Metschnikowia sp. JCM 33374]|nr:hypothetical protein JCM33374_g1489 [Metschnikowia sp. JCM 33374]
MASDKISRSKSHRKVPPGPVNSTSGVPYDYIVVVDAGSHGSRAYVYNWLNPQHALDAGIDISVARKVNLVRRIFGDEKRRSKSKPDGDSGSDSEADSDDESGSVGVKFPAIHNHKKWHRAIKPGLSSFNQSPQKVGKHHLGYLLNLASSVVPKSQHHRTPIFIHATAGMRLLPPNEQEPILENVCQYLRTNSDFFMPDCKSHVNIIDGNIEGLYGWLSINYLVGSFDRPDEHQHGKNHTTYGLLDMGGASTQVVFQPNSTETEEHKNNMYKVSLYKLPEALNGTSRDLSYNAPKSSDLFVYSDSFLGFGMFQAHNRYLKFLLEDFRKVNELPEDAYRFRTPIPDPCLPKGYTFTGSIDDRHVDFTGNSDFQQCLKSIFPVLSNSTHTSPKAKYNVNCQQLNEESEVSSCLLNDKIPSFDFDINHFIGVSGYWDIVNSLLASQSLPSHDPQNEKYDYKLIYQKTQQLCSSPLNELLEMNSLRDKKTKIQEEELAELCFKASWILNFLHVGLGFPRFGIDEVPNKNEKFKSLELVEKFGGSSFSWTLGRAILYANDEYIQAYNNYTKSLDPLSDELPRPGYTYTAAEGAFIYGAESENVLNRPLFTAAAQNAKYPHYDYESNYKDANESKWNIQPHRLFGSFIFVSLMLLALFFLIGKRGRSLLLENVGGGFKSIWGNKVAMLIGRGKSTQYGPLGGVEPIEMSSIEAGKTSEGSDVFRIDDENENE